MVDSSSAWSGFLSALTEVSVEAAKKALGVSDAKVVPQLPPQAVTPTKEVLPWWKRLEVVIPAIAGAVFVGWLLFKK